MKTILEHGTPPNIPDETIFTCPCCDCVFKAEKGDWNIMARWDNIALMTYCPECGQKSYVSIL